MKPVQHQRKRDAPKRYDKQRLVWLGKCERGDMVMTTQGEGVIYTLDPKETLSWKIVGLSIFWILYLVITKMSLILTCLALYGDSEAGP